MDKSEVMSSVTAYAEAVREQFGPKEIILYGSYAKGTAHQYSDIDIAVIFDKITGNYLKTATALCMLCRGINIDIEPVLLEDGDDPSGFLNEVRKTGQVIYTRQ